jgi:hypothetical protein
MLSPLDDYPIHQISEPIRHVGTSDRNFYDRYYFNLHGCSDELFLVTGMGQYPNLGVQDAFAVVIRNGIHRVVRASRELGNDRMDTSVGPFRVEVLEGLKRLRVVLEPNEFGISMDAVFEGGMQAFHEQRHFIRQFGRVVFDTSRLAQTGFWTGTLQIGDESFEIAPDRWWGTRDRSWGVRPVGEAEPPGIRATTPLVGGLWSYAPMQFRDYSIMYICQESGTGERALEEAVRIPALGRPGQPEQLGRPEFDFEFVSGTRRVKRARLHLMEPSGRKLEIAVTPLLPMYVGVGTGYGFDADWRHGMYQGALKVEGFTLDTRDPANKARLFGLVDNVARFELDGDVGYGLFEYMLMGPNARFGFKNFEDTAP